MASNREGMKELISLALTKGNVKATELAIFAKVSESICALAKSTDQKAIKALEALKERGLLTDKEFEDKMVQVSDGVNRDTIKATQWLRSGLHLTADVAGEVIQETKTQKPQKESKAA